MTGVLVLLVGICPRYTPRIFPSICGICLSVIVCVSVFVELAFPCCNPPRGMNAHVINNFGQVTTTHTDCNADNSVQYSTGICSRPCFTAKAWWQTLGMLISVFSSKNRLLFWKNHFFRLSNLYYLTMPCNVPCATRYVTMRCAVIVLHNSHFTPPIQQPFCIEHAVLT